MAVITRLLDMIRAPRAAPRPRTRLTETEALAIARAALEQETALRVAEVVETDAGPEWRIATATVGSGDIVHIADGTGLVTAKRRWGFR